MWEAQAGGLRLAPGKNKKHIHKISKAKKKKAGDVLQAGAPV
jgi:hypothetical protein